jgi:hypothetical protein
MGFLMLEKSNIAIPVNAFLDTKSDPFLTDAQTSLAHENVRFYQVGALLKRPGLAPLGTISGSPKRLASDNKQLFALKNPGPEQCDAYLDNWETLESFEKYGSINGAQIKALEFFGGEAFSTGGWHDFYDGKHAVVANQYKQTGSGAAQFPEVYLYDGKNYRALNGDLSFPISASTDFINSAKCAWIDVAGINYLVVAGRKNDGANSLVVMVLNDTLTSQVFYASYPMTSFSGTVAICTRTDRSSAYVAFRNNTNSISIREFNNSGLVSSGSVATVSNIGSVIDIAFLGSQIAMLTSKTSESYPEVTAVNLSYVTQWTQTGTSGALSLGTIGLVNAGAIWPSQAGFTFNYTSRVTATFEVTTSAWFVDSLGFIERGRDYHVTARGRGIDDGTQTVFPVFSSPTNPVSGGFGTSLQSSIGIIRIDNNSSGQDVKYIASAFFERHYQTGLGAIHSSFANVGGSKYAFIVLEPLRVVYNPALAINDFASRVVLAQVDLANSDAQYGTVLNIGDSLLTLDGLPSFLDGSRQVPIGTYFRPFINCVGSTSGGSLAAGTYLVKVVFETYDSQGNLIESCESNQNNIVTTGASSSIALTLRLSKWYGFCTVSIYVSRTNAANLQLLETRVANVANPNFTYTITSQPVTTAPFIYTLGGVLENTPCPPAKHASLFNDRVLIVPADDFDKVYYSNKYINGEIPSFSSFLFVQQASSTSRYRDEIVGAAGIGDKLIIFRENSIYWVAGDGANLLGADSTFSQPEILSQDIGCTNPKSIILTPVGIMFQSAKGIYMITGGLALEYIGASVEAYNAEAVIDSCLITQRNIVLMATSSRILCFDYLSNRWSIDTIANVSSLAVFQNKIVALKSSGAVSIETTTFTDNFGEMTPPSIQMKLITGWMKLTGIQDFGRVTRVLVLGRWKSSHSLTVKAYYDYDDSTVETYTQSITATPGLYQYNIHLRRQKCESLKLEIFDTGSGQSLDLVGITLEVGVKKGTMKVPAARKL